MSEKCVDHLGKEYDSLSKMCEAWKIEYNTFRYRRKIGCSLEECLTGTVYDRNRKKCVDHLGVEYKTTSEMCKVWGINKDVYKYRRKLGYSVEDCLTCKFNDARKVRKHDKGNYV